MARGTLRIFLGAAPGVGKTFAMLQEAHQLLANGRDVIVGVASDHGRKQTLGLMSGLEIAPHRQDPSGVLVQELDVDAVLARRPEVAVVDEYAHKNAPGSRNQHRWQDIELLLAAGIDVLSTVSIQHLASLEDVVSAITGQLPGETVPDDIVRRADQIELVDVAPELLLQRLSAGNVYPAEMVDAALANEFRLGNLFALREISLIWLADRVDEGLAKYRANEGITRPGQRGNASLSDSPAARKVRHSSGGLPGSSPGSTAGISWPFTCGAAEGQPEEASQALASQRRLSTDLGGSYHTVVGEDAAESLLEFARSVNATQIVVGVSRGRLLSRLLGSSVGTKVVRGSGDIDVHMVSHPLGARALPRAALGRIGPARTTAGFILAVLHPRPDHQVMSFAPELNLATQCLSISPVCCRGFHWRSLAGGSCGPFGRSC